MRNTFFRIMTNLIPLLGISLGLTLSIKAIAQEDLNQVLFEIKNELTTDSNKIIAYDSLLSRYYNSFDTLSQYKILNQKACHYIRINEASKAVEILEQLLKDSVYIKDPDLKRHIYFNMGFAYMENLQYETSFPYFNTALSLAENSNDTLLRARALHFTGVESFINGRNIEAVKKMYEAYLILDEYKDYEYLLHSANDLGVFFMTVKNGEKAYDFLKLAVKYDSLNPIDIRSYQPIIYTNLGVLYLNIIPQFDSSTYYNNLALEKMHINSTWLDRFPAINNLQVINLKAGNANTALQYFKRAYEDDKLKKVPYHYSGVLLNYSSALMQNNENKKAYQIALEALKLSKENNRKQYVYSALINLYKLDSIKGEFKKALELYQQAISAENDLNANEIELELIRLKIDSELEIIDKNYQDLLYQNQLIRIKIDQLSILNFRQWLLIVIFLGISIVLVILLVKNKRLYNNLSLLNNEQEKNNRLLRAQSQKIEEENINKDRIISLLSHDFRSPLSNLTALISALFDNWEELDDADKITHLRKLNIQTINTLNNVEETLSWAQLNRNKIKPHFSDFLISDIYEKIKFDTETNLKNKNIHLLFENQISETIRTDSEILGHIIHNLLNNAIKFTPKNGIISLISMPKENEIEIIVKDSGIGIPDDQVNKLFSENHHFNRKGTEGENTTGLGLVIVKKLCIILGAKITIKSQVGIGSEFIISLPFKKEA